MPIVFACLAPHPPLLLPSVGLKEDREKVKNTLEAFEKLRVSFSKAKSKLIVISSPHKNWGFDVPLYFLTKSREKSGPQIEVGFSSEQKKNIKTYLTGTESPQYHFDEGKKFYQEQIERSVDKLKDNIALVASGDMSHCLKENGPYGFNPDGPEFDKTFIKYLKNKDLNNIFKLDEKYPGASECGLRSFCFSFGILEAARVGWTPQILSYEGPFGVGYLVAEIKIKRYKSFRIYNY
jgi:aromatic ring-opening dioxygenase LigB subunit